MLGGLAEKGAAQATFREDKMIRAITYAARVLVCAPAAKNSGEFEAFISKLMVSLKIFDTKETELGASGACKRYQEND